MKVLILLGKLTLKFKVIKLSKFFILDADKYSG